MVGALQIPQGARGPHLRVTNVTGPDNSIHRKSSMVQIMNDDQLCMVRAIGVGLAKHCIISDEDWKVTKKAHKDLSNIEILTKHRQISVQGFGDITNKN